MFWQIHSFPQCTHHVFLSHSREDHDTLVRPVYNRLRRKGIRSWLDIEDYSYGRDSRTALRDGILRSRHIVFFITEKMLASYRGWCVMELTLGEILQSNLSYSGGWLSNIVLPLFFVKQSNRKLPRTVWQLTRDRGKVCPTTEQLDRVGWSCREILNFLDREQQLASEMRTLVQTQPQMLASLKTKPGLEERVTSFR